VTAEIEGLPAVTTKTALVTQMTLLSAQRHRSLGKAGFRLRKPAWMAGLPPAAPRPRSHHTVAALLQHTREAKELNRVNGMLINKQMNNTQARCKPAPSPCGPNFLWPRRHVHHAAAQPRFPGRLSALRSAAAPRRQATPKKWRHRIAALSPLLYAAYFARLLAYGSSAGRSEFP
jgi:hypothetical protein